MAAQPGILPSPPGAAPPAWLWGTGPRGRPELGPPAPSQEPQTAPTPDPHSGPGSEELAGRPSARRTGRSRCDTLSKSCSCCCHGVAVS